MKLNAFFIALLTLVMLSLACGKSVDVEQMAPTVQAGMQTALPTIQAAAATTGPALQTMIPPEMIPGQGLPLPGTSIPQLLDKLNQEQAALALEAYGRDVLGLNLDIKVGRSAAGDVELPVTTESGATQAMQIAGVTYYGLFQDGTASLSLGSGSTTGSDLTGSIQNASLGIFSVSLAQALPASADEALALVKATYPGIASLELTMTDQTEGFSFQTSQAQDWAIANGQIILKGTLVSAGAVPGRRAGKIVVWVTVASGTLAAPFSK